MHALIVPFLVLGAIVLMLRGQLDGWRRLLFKGSAFMFSSGVATAIMIFLGLAEPVGVFKMLSLGLAGVGCCALLAIVLPDLLTHFMGRRMDASREATSVVLSAASSSQSDHFQPVPTVLGEDGKRRTERGFRVYGELWCRYKTNVRVQESSAAFESCVWLFLRRHNGGRASAHLSINDARCVVLALQEFIEDVEQGRTSAEVELGTFDDASDDVRPLTTADE
jgi:hypothetical protein